MLSGGMRVVITKAAVDPTPLNYCELPPRSRHRSRRVLKKLAKRLIRTHYEPAIYHMGSTLYVHPTLKAFLP